MDPREERLPQWAQQMIRDLRKRLEMATEPFVREMAKLRPQMELLKARNEALTELLECAARGGHATSQVIVEVIQAYDLSLSKKGTDQ